MNSAAYTVLQEPWWWDATALNGWEQAKVVVDGEVVARWPFTRRRSFSGLTILGAPQLTNRAGPWIAPLAGKATTRHARSGALLQQLIDQLPRFHFFAQNLHPHLEYWMPLLWNDFRLEARVSYVIDDCSDLDRLEADLDETTRRQLRKARRHLAAEEIGAAQLIDIVRKTFGRQGHGMRVRPELIESALAAATTRQAGHAIGVVDSAGRLHAAALYVWDHHRMYYLLGGGDPALRSSGAGTFALWQGVRSAHERGLVFDFEGSMLPPIERFFRGFGARPDTYLNITRGRAMMRLAKSLLKGMRG